LGLLSYNQNNSSEQFYKPYSEETGQIIDNEARVLIEKQYQRVKDLLLEKEVILKALSDRLFEKETLVYKEIRDLLGERPFGIKEEYAKFVTADGGLFDIEAKETEASTATESGTPNDKPDEQAAAPVLNASKTTSS